MQMSTHPECETSLQRSEREMQISNFNSAQLIIYGAFALLGSTILFKLLCPITRPECHLLTYSATFIITLISIPITFRLYNPQRYGFSSCLALTIAWMSSAAYVLDWGQWWQKFPIPTIIGGFIGNFVALVHFLLNTRNRKMKES